jgi:hypothetical protein
MTPHEIAYKKKIEIVDGVILLLQHHKNNLAGSIHQDPYKSDFFRLFADAYNAGLMASNNLQADALANFIEERDPDLIDLTDNSTYVNLLTFWREWTYAWDRINQRHKGLVMSV